MFPVSTARVSIAWVGLAAVAAACHRPAPTPRERVLAGLPAGAVAVAVADGRALAHPRIRGVLDVVAARWPASLGCLVDAAVASDAIGLTVDPASNITVLAVLPRPPHCAVLSQREPGLWIATLGAAPSAGASVLGDPRFARARPYLESSPIAGAALGDVHFLAAAQPDPLDAWVAIDVPDGADALAQTITQQLARLSHEATTAPIAAQLHTSRPGATQIVVHLTGPFDGDLATAVRTVLAWVDAGSSAAGADPGAATGAAGQVFTCAAPTPGIACSDGTSYRVASLAADLAPIVAIGHPSPIVINGSIAGLRLEAAVRQLGLEAGDVIVAMAGRLVGSRTMLTDWIAHARGETSVTVRRGATEAVLRFAER